MIEITKYKEFQRGSMMGFVDIVIQPVGIGINGLTYFKRQDGRSWVNFPSEKYTNNEGEEKYRPYVVIPDKQRYDSFQKSCTEAIEAYISQQLPPAPVQSMEPPAPMMGSGFGQGEPAPQQEPPLPF